MKQTPVRLTHFHRSLRISQPTLLCPASGMHCPSPRGKSPQHRWEKLQPAVRHLGPGTVCLWHKRMQQPCVLGQVERGARHLGHRQPRAATSRALGGWKRPHVSAAMGTALPWVTAWHRSPVSCLQLAEVKAPLCAGLCAPWGTRTPATTAPGCCARSRCRTPIYLPLPPQFVQREIISTFFFFPPFSWCFWQRKVKLYLETANHRQKNGRLSMRRRAQSGACDAPARAEGPERSPPPGGGSRWQRGSGLSCGCWGRQRAQNFAPTHKNLVSCSPGRPPALPETCRITIYLILLREITDARTDSAALDAVR